MTSGETYGNRDAADECAALKAYLFGVADMLHNNKTDRTPLRAYGLEKSTHMKAAAKVLRLVALDLVGREEKLRLGELK